jgi:predicted alpha/beta superfamily hydrolase
MKRPEGGMAKPRRWAWIIVVLGASVPALPALAQREHTLTGTLRVHRAFHSRFLGSDRDVAVYLPPGYDAHLRQRYPVLYLHDGQNLFDGATSFIPGQEWRVDETAEALISADAVRPLIIVGIYNAGGERIREYTPTKDARYGGGGADAYGRMLVEELKPFIDGQYRTRTGPRDTGLGGSSLGGLVSLYLGLKHPETFGKLAVVSPSAWWDAGVIIRQVRALDKKPHLRIWLDTGTAETMGGRPATADTRRLRDALVARGWRLGKDLTYVEAEGAAHNEAAWARRVGPILRFLFPGRRASAAAP